MCSGVFSGQKHSWDRIYCFCCMVFFYLVKYHSNRELVLCLVYSDPCRQITLDQQSINVDRLIQYWFYVYSTISAGWDPSIISRICCWILVSPIKFDVLIQQMLPQMLRGYLILVKYEYIKWLHIYWKMASLSGQVTE